MSWIRIRCIIDEQGRKRRIGRITIHISPKQGAKSNNVSLWIVGFSVASTWLGRPRIPSTPTFVPDEWIATLLYSYPAMLICHLPFMGSCMADAASTPRIMSLRQCSMDLISKPLLLPIPVRRSCGWEGQIIGLQKVRESIRLNFPSLALLPP